MEKGAVITYSKPWEGAFPALQGQIFLRSVADELINDWKGFVHYKGSRGRFVCLMKESQRLPGIFTEQKILFDCVPFLESNQMSNKTASALVRGCLNVLGYFVTSAFKDCYGK